MHTNGTWHHHSDNRKKRKGPIVFNDIILLSVNHALAGNYAHKAKVMEDISIVVSTLK
jgi:hypothetical protein